MNITVDLSGLKIKDLALFDQARAGALSTAAMVELLDRVVVGGASELPLTQFGEIIAAVTQAMEALSNPKDGQGKA